MKEQLEEALKCLEDYKTSVNAKDYHNGCPFEAQRQERRIDELIMRINRLFQVTPVSYIKHLCDDIQKMIEYNVNPKFRFFECKTQSNPLQPVLKSVLHLLLHYNNHCECIAGCESLQAAIDSYSENIKSFSHGLDELRLLIERELNFINSGNLLTSREFSREKSFIHDSHLDRTENGFWIKIQRSYLRFLEERKPHMEDCFFKPFNVETDGFIKESARSRNGTLLISQSYLNIAINLFCLQKGLKSLRDNPLSEENLNGKLQAITKDLISLQKIMETVITKKLVFHKRILYFNLNRQISNHSEVVRLNRFVDKVNEKTIRLNQHRNVLVNETNHFLVDLNSEENKRSTSLDSLVPTTN